MKQTELTIFSWKLPQILRYALSNIWSSAPFCSKFSDGTFELGVAEHIQM
ncbi:MAG: hypothetical protein ABFS08_10345 [Pseudomonadota bacterium]